MKKIQYKINQLENPENFQSLINLGIIDNYRNFELTEDNLSVLNLLLAQNHLLYRWGDYHYLPMYFDDNETESEELKYINNIVAKFCRYFNPYIYMLKHIDNDLKFIGLKTNKTSLSTKNGTIDKTYDNTIATIDTDNGMTENSPITSDINTINSPTFKSKNINDKSSTKTGNDVDTHSFTNNVEETNPELFSKYMRLYKEYNLIEIVEKCYRKIIAEFNSSL